MDEDEVMEEQNWRRDAAELARVIRELTLGQGFMVVNDRSSVVVAQL